MVRALCGMVLVLTWLFCGVGTVLAHFGMLIPSTGILTQKQRQVELALSFSHPFELVGMDMPKPAQFYIFKDGEVVDLRHKLMDAKIMGHQGWHVSHRVNRPGVYQFVMEPLPYWEPAEDLSIIHYTKVFIAAYGADTGWDQPVGLPTEIVPMLRPFGNYAGNSFVGQVLVQGKPAAFAEVEVELFNESGSLEAASEYHVTQVIKADGNGAFSFTCPRVGWWGFAALSEANYTLKNPEGQDKGVELGAVLWVYMDKYVTK